LRKIRKRQIDARLDGANQARYFDVMSFTSWFLTAVAGLAVLSGCATRENRVRAEQGREVSKRFDDKLHVGMAFEDVAALGERPANCVGSPKSVQKCEVRNLVLPTRKAPFQFNDVGGTFSAGNPGTALYEIYRLQFKAGKLESWEKSREPNRE